MDPVHIGIIGIIFLFVFMALGMPIGMCMGLVGFAGLYLVISPEAALLKLGVTFFTMTANYFLAVLPLFLIMGEFAAFSGLTKDAYNTASKWLGHMPGGLAMATIGGCAGFAATTGSSGACAVTMAIIARPQMDSHGYAPQLSLGCIAAGGTLGILIPPSVGFIVYGIVTEVSIGKLFLAGIIPGIVLASVFMVIIYFLAKFNPRLGPPGPRSNWRERISSVKDTWGLLLLFLTVIGGIYSGAFTPTEAGAMGAFLAFIVAIVKKTMTKENAINAVLNTIRTTGMVFVIIIGSTIFNYFIAACGLGLMLGDFIGGLTLSPVIILIMFLLLFFILGCIMDAFAMMILIVPILFPIFTQLGFDPVWFGVICVIMIEMGLCTPPIGMNVFILAGVAKDVPMFTVFKGIWPFVGGMVIVVALLVAFPQIALILPTIMKGV